MVTNPQTEPTTARGGRGQVLVGLMLTMALAAMDTTIVATAVPSIVSDLGGFSLFPWLFSTYLLTQAVSIPAYGRLADLYGRKPVLIIGTLIFLAGSVLSGIAWNMVWLIVFRALQGIGAGSIQPITTTVLGDLYSVEERARVQGWLASVWGVSAVIGPALGGLLAEYASWRWIFYINVPIGAAALLMIGTHLQEQVAHRRHRLDVLGAALLIGGSGLLIFGLLEGGVRWPWLSPASLGVFALAVGALWAFVWVEGRVAEPTVPLWVARHRLLAGSNLAVACGGLLVIGLSSFLPAFAQGVLGVGPVAAGFALAAMSIGWPLASSLSGHLYLRIGFRDTGLIGLVLCLGAGLGFAALPRDVPLWVAACASFVMGVGLGLVNTAIIVGVQSMVDWGRRGVVTGANVFARMIGSAIGAAVFGGISNSTLSAWLRDAPRALQGQVPDSLNAASRLIAGALHAAPAAERYVRDGLYLASHRVFWGLAVAALIGCIALLGTPRRFEPLALDGE